MTPTTTLRNFRSLTKFSYIGLPLNMREQLTAARTYYVRTDGSDSNNGLANTTGGAFLTIQKAVNVVCGTLDLASWGVTIQVADGTYAESVTLYPYIGRNRAVVLKGNVTTPANVLVNASQNAITCPSAGPSWNVQYLKVQSSAASGINAYACGVVFLTNVHFGACGGHHILSTQNGVVFISGNYSITGGAQSHILAGVGGAINFATGQTLTLTGTPNFSSAFAFTYTDGVIFAVGLTFSGTATGQRYSSNLLSVIQANAGATYFPGSVAGGTANGGIYA